MKVNLSKYAGFCDGVKRAYDAVVEIAKNPETKRPIVVLGSLVHNRDVVEKIKELGVEKIEFDGNIENVKNKIDESIGTLVITAHGISPEIFEIARGKGIDVVDTTCPKVIKAQRLAQTFSKKGNQVVIIGEKKHKEVQGIFGWADNRATIVENESDVDNLDLRAEEDIVVVSQTTQNEDWVGKIADRILEKYPAAKFFNTVCSATKNRQSDVSEIARQNDVVLVIGSPESSNSNRLWEISSEINPKTYFVEGIGDIKNEWFSEAKSVGIVAGASSPKWVIDEVVSGVLKM